MAPNPNWFAIFALVVWPALSLYFYFTRPVTQATLWTILGAYLLLPVGANLHIAGIPQLDKETSGNLGALLGILLVLRRPLRLTNGFGLTELLLIALLITPFITEELNTDPIVFPTLILPGGTHYDALSAVVRQFLLLIPFFVGRQLLRAPTDIQAILRILVIAGLFYSLPILFEIRVSPQLHFWIYGYFPTEFIENVRQGGFRPVVFLGHGLAVAFFIMTTAVASAAHWRSHTRLMRLSPAIVTGYLSVILVFCKGIGSLIYGAVLIPLVYLSGTRFQSRIAVLLVTVALFYPLLRLSDLVPVRTIVEAATAVSGEDRASSLEFRFDQEQQLLNHAYSRLFFGWGRFGRGLVYDQYGHNISTVDGEWIIVLGMFGLVGFVAEFGLLVLPIYRAASALRFAKSTHDRIFLAALSLISAVNTFDLLPNSELSSWTWLIAGALLGRAEALRAMVRERKGLSSLSLARRRHLMPTH